MKTRHRKTEEHGSINEQTVSSTFFNWYEVTIYKYKTIFM